MKKILRLLLILISVIPLLAWEEGDTFLPNGNKNDRGNKKVAFVFVACDSMWYVDHWETDKQLALYRHNVDTLLNSIYPIMFTFPDGQNLMNKIPTSLDSLKHRDLISAAIPDWFNKMTSGKLTITPKFIMNPNRPNGLWVLPGNSSKYGNNNGQITNAAKSKIIQTLGATALTCDSNGIAYDHVYFLIKRFTTGTIYDPTGNPWWSKFFVTPDLDVICHEFAHQFMNLPDRGSDCTDGFSLSPNNNIGSRYGIACTQASPYDMMAHNGSDAGAHTLYGIRSLHSFDRINRGYIETTDIAAPTLNGLRSLIRIKAASDSLNDIDRINGVKSVIKVQIPDIDNTSGSLLNQYFLVDYHNGSNYDRFRGMYNSNYNTGVLITHVARSYFDIEAATPFPEFWSNGQPYRNADSSRCNWIAQDDPKLPNYPGWYVPIPSENGLFYAGKYENDWMDDYNTNPYKPFLGEKGAWWKAPSYPLANAVSKKSDFFNATDLNKFTPSTRPSSRSWHQKDTHIAVYIQSISGEYADIAVYRNYWSRPLTEATTTINQNCFFGENFTVAAGQILEIGNNLTACVVEKGTFTVKSGATLKIGSNSYLNIENRCNFILEPGAVVEMGENAAINANTQANIYAIGTADQPITIRNPRNGALWNGISSGFSGGLNGEIDMEYCNFTGMLGGIVGAPSTATIQNCNFSSVGVAINLANCNKADITDNYFYGRDAFNTAITLTQSIGSIERNQITNFGTGIKIISSSPNITGNDIYGNAICGLTSDGINGKPVVTRNNIYNNGNTATGLKAQIEIYETSNVYLANGNNNIYGTLNSNNTPFVPCIRKNAVGLISRALNATGNYWGSSRVDNSFFSPVTGGWINYSPYSATAYNNKSGGDATPENLLLTTGLAAQKAGDLTTAENSFSALITKFADTPESYQAAAALLENYLLGNKDLNKLLTQYAALGASSSWTDSRFFAEMTFKTLLSQQNNNAAFAKATALFNSAANDREKILARIDQFLSASSDNKAQNLGKTNLNALLIMLENGKFTDLAGETLNNNLPANYRLYNSYPNPFNPSTTIKFDLPVNSLVKLAVYDVAGRQVAVLANGLLNGGTHSMEFNGARLASGVYFYQLEAEGKIIGRNKMMLLK